MGFTPIQKRQLKSKLKPSCIKHRDVDGRELSYLEGWHVIGEANRIFGFDGWSRETLECKPVYTKHENQRYVACYVAKVRISVLCDGKTIVRDGTGTSEADGTTPGQAHDQASKSAETDATKRAFVTFGNPFGLALYNGDIEVKKANKSKPRQRAQKSDVGPKQITVSDQLHKKHRDDDNQKSERKPVKTDRVLSVDKTISSDPELKTSISRNLSRNRLPRRETTSPYTPRTRSMAKIDKSALTLSEPLRIRDKEHLRFVAKHPCVICGKNRSQAHHLKYMQPGAMALKVSDEFTVPLCSIHHQELHAAGDEQAWWAKKSIVAEEVAMRLWTENKKQKINYKAN